MVFSREEYLRQVDAKLQEYRDRIAELRSTLQGEGRRSDLLIEVDRQTSRLERHAAVLRKSDDRQWDEAKEALEEAWDSLNRLMSGARSVASRHPAT